MQRELQSSQRDAGGLNESAFETVSLTLMITFLPEQPMKTYLSSDEYASHVEQPSLASSSHFSGISCSRK